MATNRAVKDVNVIAILDMSGSMAGLEDDTRGGFNTFVNEAQQDQAAEGGTVTLSLTCFDTEFIQVYPPTDIQQVRPIGPAEYTPRGGTALLDAIGLTIAQMSFPAHQKVLVYIVTDGFENSSREWTNARVKALIEERETQGWEFLFVGAEVDAWDASAAFASAQMSRSSISAKKDRMAMRSASAKAKWAAYQALRADSTVADAVDALYASDDEDLIDRSKPRREDPASTSATDTTPTSSARKPRPRKTFREWRHS
jgi:uncharacterized protein YegL